MEFRQYSVASLFKQALKFQTPRKLPALVGTRNSELSTRNFFLGSPVLVSYRAAMRPLRALVIYIAVVLVGNALLAPRLYWLVQTGAQISPKLANAPFHRYVNGSLLILALAGLWPLFKAFGAESTVDVGLVNPSGRWQKLATGFALGFPSLAVVPGGARLAGARAWPEDLVAGKLAGKLLGAAGTAAVVTVLVVILFRAEVFGGWRRAFNWRLACVVLLRTVAVLPRFPAASDKPFAA